MLGKLKPFFTVRFAKFCVVGGSGVVVNLVFLALFSDFFTLNHNLASALAIEISINTNFLINNFWTFQDRASSGTIDLNRWLKFHIVSMGGAAIQWLVFVLCNLAWFVLLFDESAAIQGDGVNPTSLSSDIYRSIVDPPDVGNLKYLSQIIGVGCATFWNFFLNFYWTWKTKKGLQYE